MDVTSAFKSEIFRPLTTVVIPGSVAVAPYVILVGYYVPVTFKFWDDHPAAVVTVMVIAAIAAGLILDNIGTHIEAKFFDKWLEKRRLGHNAQWREYLGLELKDELIGQRYLRTKVERLKFELAMGPAVVAFAVGLAWLQFVYQMWRWPGFGALFVCLTLGVVYLLREAYKTARLLSDTRAIVLEAAKKRTRPVVQLAAAPDANRCVPVLQVALTFRRRRRR